EQYKDGWTLKDMIDYYHSKPEGTKLYMYESKKEIFDEFVAPFIDDYIDWDTGKVNFDSEEFRAAAAFCNEFPSDYEFGIDYNDVAKQMREGTMLINLLSESEGTMGEYQLNRALYGDDLRCIGFPSADKKKAYICPLSASLAITASSEEKEGAWDFLKSAITDYHMHAEIPSGIPSGKKQFEKVIRRITATEKYTDEDGNVVRPLDGISEYNSFEFDIKPFSEDETNVIRGLIKNSVVKNDNTSVLFIVETELDSYFRGDNTLDETVSVLQDRVGKYVNENR
ncbi:MAG: hypothetical protein K2K09_02050, partial [Lachnospiraceae bacterium]|nr:hypothetical protein [Lachnospiraceae bacterium]